MAVNPAIAMGVRGIELADPLTQYGRVAAIQQAQQQNALAQQQMAEYERARAEEESLRNYLTQSDLTKPETRAGLMRFGKTGLAYGKVLTEQDTARLTQQKTEMELKAARKKFGDELKRNLSANPSNENVVAWGQDAVLQGIYTPQEVESTVQQLLALPPADRVRILAQSGATAAELAPKLSVGPTGIVQTPAFGGKATIVEGTAPAFQMTPAQKDQAERDRQRLGLEAQRVGLEGKRVDIAQRESERKIQGLEALPPKEIQKREAALPQATAAVKGFEAKSAAFVNDLIALRDHPGLSEITGFAAGRLPGLTSAGRAAQALYDKVVAKGGFQALQDMRDASKTGGALGNVSNQEGKQLTASFAAIDRKQDAPDVQAAINQAIGDIEGAKVRMKEAYDSTYAYKAGAPAQATNAPPPKLSPQDKEALTWANSNPNDPRAAAIKQRLGVQ